MNRVVTGLLAFVMAAMSASAAEPERPEMATPAGSTHTCAGFYPEAERAAHVEGVTTLAFHIRPDGTVAEVTVAKSSGNGDLDDAAKSCVRTWRYLPVTKNGASVEAAWSAEVEWRGNTATPILDPSTLPVLLNKAPVCNSYPWWAKKDNVEGNAKLHYTIGADGHTSAITFAKSSGNADLDKAAQDCVASLEYRTPVESKPADAEATWSSLGGHSSVVSWVFHGSITEAEAAIAHLTGGVLSCLRGAAAHQEFVSGLKGITTIWVRYERGEIADVSVLRSSGNDGLDRFAVDCFKLQPHDSERAHAMRKVGHSVFPVVWQRYLAP